MSDLFRIPLRNEPWPKGPHDRRPCVVCAESWIPWPGSRLQCHGRCLFTDDGAAHVVKLFRENPTSSNSGLAARLGISIGVLRATLHAHGVRMR